MKLLLVTFAVLVASCAATEESVAEVVSSTYEREPEGTYKAAYETANGIVSQSEGVLKTGVEKDVPPSLVVKGTVSYVDREGKKIEFLYEADENGYRVSGEHLPTPPPVPVYIEKSLQYIKEHPYTEKTN